MHVARKPLAHFYNSMMKKRPAHEPNNLARMVWFGAGSIATELLSLLNLRYEAWETIIDDIPAVHVSSYSTFISALVLQQLGNFDRRILETVQKDPLRLLWLVKEPADIPCPKRKTICTDILGSDEDALHITAFKLKVVFREELQSCAGDGVDRSRGAEAYANSVDILVRS